MNSQKESRVRRPEREIYRPGMFRSKVKRGDDVAKSKKPDQLLYVPPKAKNQDGVHARSGSCAVTSAASSVQGDSDSALTGHRIDFGPRGDHSRFVSVDSCQEVQGDLEVRTGAAAANRPRADRNKPRKRHETRPRGDVGERMNGFDEGVADENQDRANARRRYRGRRSSDRKDGGPRGPGRIPGAGSGMPKRDSRALAVEGVAVANSASKRYTVSSAAPSLNDVAASSPKKEAAAKTENKKRSQASAATIADDVSSVKRTEGKEKEAPTEPTGAQVTASNSGDDYLALLKKMDRFDWSAEVDRQEELNLQRQKQEREKEKEKGSEKQKEKERKQKDQKERFAKKNGAKAASETPAKERQEGTNVKRGGLIQLPASIHQEARQSRGSKRDGRREHLVASDLPGRGRRSRNNENAYRRMPNRDDGYGLERVGLRRPSTPDYGCYMASKPSMSPFGKLIDSCNVRHAYYSNPDICSENFANDIPRNLTPTIFTEICEVEAQMGINGPACTVDERSIDLDRMLRLRKQLEKLYHDAVIVDVEYTFRHNLEHCMWKMAFYQPVELLRSLAWSSSSQTERCQTLLLHLLEDATLFYEDFIAEYEEKYGFRLADYFRHIDEDLYKPLEPVAKSTIRQVKLALYSSQRFLIALGDLARYREQFSSPSNFGKSRSWYIKAVQLAPHNGRPYNQLALLAVYTRRKLDAVYHYVRSLAVKHPFLTATESLMGVFDEVTKKVDNYEEILRAEFEYQRLTYRGSFENVERRRLTCRELWISPDGVKSSEIPDKVSAPSETELLTKSSTSELFRRCIMYFLHLTGMLYTKIGMEKFENFAVKFLIQLQELLERDDDPATALNFIQIIMISLFIVHHTSMKEVDSDICLALQHNAVQFSLSIFGILLKRVKDLLFFEELSQSSKELHLFLPALHIFCQWLATPATYKLYSTLASLDGVETEKFYLKIWSTFADVCNFLESAREKGLFRICPQDKGGNHYEKIILPEDLYCSAFFDVFESIPVTRSVDRETDSAVGADYLRLESILVLAYYLDGQESFVFRYADQDRKFVALSRSSSPGLPLPRLAASDDEDGSDDAAKNNKPVASDIVVSDDVRLLRMYQQSTEAKQAVLESEKCQIEIEICPSYIVLDTNAFIYHLPLITKLIEARKFVIVVPLVVLSELEGLCRHQEDEEVATNSRAALNYLYDASDKGTKFLKAITSQGNMIDSFRNSHEMIMSKDCNDDKILKCCLSFCNDEKKTEIRNLKDEPLLLHRNVVLLTGDRNLRIKALAENVPVRTVQSFLKWAKIS